MASFAPAEHLSQYHQHWFSSETLARFARRVASLARRLATAHHQRVQDRILWELALTDPRVVGELQAIRDQSQPHGFGR